MIHNIKPVAQDVNGNTSLHLAADVGTRDLALTFILAAGDMTSSNDDDFSPLSIAVQRQQRDVIELLIQTGVDVNQAGKSGWRPIHLAPENGNVVIADLLLKAGCYLDVTMTDLLQLSIRVACHHNQLQMCRWLIAHGESVNEPNSEGWTPLLIACQVGSDVIVTELLNSGVERDVKLEVLETLFA